MNPALTDILWYLAIGVIFFIMMRKGGCCGGHKKKQENSENRIEHKH